MLESVFNICISELVEIYNLLLENRRTDIFILLILATILYGLRLLYTVYNNEKEKSEQISDSRFLRACRSGDIKLVDQMMRYGANIFVTNMNGEGAIHMAALHYTVNLDSNNIELLDLLLHAGCPVNISSNTGCTPLHIAAGSGDSELVNLLLNFGADRNVEPNPGQLAHSLCHYRVAELLSDN